MISLIVSLVLTPFLGWQVQGGHRQTIQPPTPQVSAIQRTIAAEALQGNDFDNEKLQPAEGYWLLDSTSRVDTCGLSPCIHFEMVDNTLYLQPALDSGGLHVDTR